MKYSNQFNNQALRKFTALDLDLLMAIASRVRDKGTDEVAFTFEELKRLAGLQRNMTNGDTTYFRHVGNMLRTKSDISAQRSEGCAVLARPTDPAAALLSGVRCAGGWA